MKNIAIFASGSGSNAENIIDFFQNSDEIQVKLIVSNKADAYVLQRAKSKGIPALTITREMFYHSTDVINILDVLKIDLIVLAGFLWLVPESLVNAFETKIINIHPALLPNYGGKGMYGKKVHEAVKANGEKETGITIHYVNEAYDEGNIVAQFSCELSEMDTVDDIASKIHDLEMIHFPEVIATILEA